MGIARNISDDLYWSEFIDGVVDQAGILDDQTDTLLRGAFASLPRIDFVEGLNLQDSCQDISVPIGFDRKLTKPSTMVRMLSLLNPRRGMKVLELSSGCGYQAALLSKLGLRVFTVETQGLLAQRTRRFLDTHGHQNVMLHRGDPLKGWPEHAPYDGIILADPVQQIDSEIVKQLDPQKGRLIAPVIEDDGARLVLIEMRQGVQRTVKLEKIKFD